VKRKVIAIGIALLCAANIVSAASAANEVRTASTPTTYCTGSFYVKEGDAYKMARNKCPQAPDAEVVCVTAATVDPGTLLIWPANDTQDPMFHALTYAGIQDGEIVLTRDPGPSIRLPIKGIFTKYGILDIKGFRIILDIVYPDKIKAKVRHAAKRCRCR
jgi:hypothetical protein